MVVGAAAIHIIEAAFFNMSAVILYSQAVNFSRILRYHSIAYQNSEQVCLYIHEQNIAACIIHYDGVRSTPYACYPTRIPYTCMPVTVSCHIAFKARPDDRFERS